MNSSHGTHHGRVYVYSGLTGAELYNWYGSSSNDHLGASVSDAGDVDNDGYADVIVGADGSYGNYGLAYVYSGRTGMQIHMFSSGRVADGYGVSVSGAGDVNNDGYDDLIVGADLDTTAAAPFAGRVYVYSGQTGGLLYTIEGEQAEARLGHLGKGSATLRWISPSGALRARERSLSQAVTWRIAQSLNERYQTSMTALRR